MDGAVHMCGMMMACPAKQSYKAKAFPGISRGGGYILIKVFNVFASLNPFSYKYIHIEFSNFTIVILNNCLHVLVVILSFSVFALIF